MYNQNNNQNHSDQNPNKNSNGTSSIKIVSHVVDDYQTNPNLLYKPPRPSLARSIKDLTTIYAKLPPIEPGIKIKLYLQSILNLYERGTECWSDGDLERAYVYYLKMSILFVEELPKKHPRFYDLYESRPGLKGIDLTELRLKAKQKCSGAIKNMEVIKPKLIEYYKKLPPKVEKKLDIVTLQKKTAEHTGLSMEKVSKFIPRTQEELDKMMELRRILLPRTILDAFLEFFETNTNNGIESCALISGVIEKGQIKVTHLLIPKQRGTYTTCCSLDEAQICTYHTEFNLMLLGWIHTHPEFDCFLSSIDLHMQLGYQVIMPEAIAVVLAPKREKSRGIFSLTKTGLDTLKKCSKGTTFHPHLEHNLYKEAEHVQLIDSEDYQIVDLRKDYRTR